MINMGFLVNQEAPGTCTVKDSLGLHCFYHLGLELEELETPLPPRAVAVQWGRLGHISCLLPKVAHTQSLPRWSDFAHSSHYLEHAHLIYFHESS